MEYRVGDLIWIRDKKEEREDPQLYFLCSRPSAAWTIGDWEAGLTHGEPVIVLKDWSYTKLPYGGGNNPLTFIYVLTRFGVGYLRYTGFFDPED